jgi:hypothetical protein
MIMIFLGMIIQLIKKKDGYEVIKRIQDIIKIEKVVFVFYVNGESYRAVHRIFAKNITYVSMNVLKLKVNKSLMD